MEKIQWRDWTPEAFALAQAEDKPILLDLTAVWCHWCHIMDETSYSDAEVIRLVRAELSELRENGPGEAELRVAKEHLKGSLMLSLESTASRMSNLARQEFYFGRQLTLEETLAGVEGVTRSRVHGLVRDLLTDRRLAAAAVGRVARLKTKEEDLEL